MKTLKLISLLCISIFFLSCKKNDKVETIVDFHLYNPVTNVPFPNVPVYVYKVKGTGYYYEVNSVEEYQNSIIWEGVTDSEGKAQAKFLATDVKKYNYWARPQLSFAHGKEIIISPDEVPLILRENNSIVYKVVEGVNQIVSIKNLNCFDGTDKMRYRLNSIPFQSIGQWRPMTSDPYYYGCQNFLGSYSQTHQNIYEVEIEVTRNGETSIIRDTFFRIGNNGVDTLKLHY